MSGIEREGKGVIEPEEETRQQVIAKETTGEEIASLLLQIDHGPYDERIRLIEEKTGRTIPVARGSRNRLLYGIVTLEYRRRVLQDPNVDRGVKLKVVKKLIWWRWEELQEAIQWLDLDIEEIEEKIAEIVEFLLTIDDVEFHFNAGRILYYFPSAGVLLRVASFVKERRFQHQGKWKELLKAFISGVGIPPDVIKHPELFLPYLTLLENMINTNELARIDRETLFYIFSRLKGIGTTLSYEDFEHIFKYRHLYAKVLEKGNVGRVETLRGIRHAIDNKYIEVYLAVLSKIDPHYFQWHEKKGEEVQLEHPLITFLKNDWYWRNIYEVIRAIDLLEKLAGSMDMRSLAMIFLSWFPAGFERLEHLEENLDFKERSEIIQRKRWHMYIPLVEQITKRFINIMFEEVRARWDNLNLDEKKSLLEVIGSLIDFTPFFGGGGPKIVRERWFLFIRYLIELFSFMEWEVKNSDPELYIEYGEQWLLSLFHPLFLKGSLKEHMEKVRRISSSYRRRLWSLRGRLSSRVSFLRTVARRMVLDIVRKRGNKSHVLLGRFLASFLPGQFSIEELRDMEEFFKEIKNPDLLGVYEKWQRWIKGEGNDFLLSVLMDFAKQDYQKLVARIKGHPLLSEMDLRGPPIKWVSVNIPLEIVRDLLKEGKLEGLMGIEKLKFYAELIEGNPEGEKYIRTRVKIEEALSRGLAVWVNSGIVYGTVMLEGIHLLSGLAPVVRMDDPAFQRYGDVVLRISPEKIENRTTVTVGDSFTTHQDNRLAPWADMSDGIIRVGESYPLKRAPELWQLRELLGINERYKDVTDMVGGQIRYIEAQIFGGLSLKDIAEIVIPEDKLDELMSRIGEEGKRSLIAAGIKVKVWSIGVDNRYEEREVRFDIE